MVISISDFIVSWMGSARLNEVSAGFTTIFMMLCGRLVPVTYAVIFRTPSAKTLF